MEGVDGADEGAERLEVGLPGMIRRVRRILDVSQRGLAALLKVSQSVVARWETGRTSPRARVVEQLLRMAPLRATGWWVPRRLRSMTSVEAFAWHDRSRRVGDPAIRYNASPFWKAVERQLNGIPDDHPAVHQLAAEVRYLDERREERYRPRAA
jgi:transcriptional regulator with XRE-family HTH domain